MLVRYPGYDAVGRALAGHFALANLRLGFQGSQGHDFYKPREEVGETMGNRLDG